MGRGRRREIDSDQDEAVKNRRVYRFEFTAKQLFAYSLGSLAVICWMFVFGVLIGRGIPLGKARDVSLHGQFLRFLGLTKGTPAATEKAAETWEDPKKMLESLSYYEDLTRKQKSDPSAGAKGGIGPSTLSPTTQADSSAGQKTKPLPSTTSSAEEKVVPAPSQGLPQKSSDEASLPSNISEHFTLLISSLREKENAQRLLEQLRAKGYSPRIESLDLSGMGRWNRVLVGSFRSREEATRFATEFNRKERMEALVIRDGS